MQGQRGLDLAQLDAVAAHLHLMIDAPEAIERAIRAPGHKIARGIHLLAYAPGVGLETLRAALRQIEIAAADTDAAQPELALLANNNRAKLLIEHVEMAVGHPAANHHRIVMRVFRAGDAVKSLGIGAFGRAVGVDHLGATQRIFDPGLEARLGDHLAAQEDMRETGERAPGGFITRFQQAVERAGCAVEAGNAALGDAAQDQLRVVDRRVQQHYATTH